MRVVIEDHKELKDDIIRVIRGQISEGHFKVFFFGSRINGKGTERSDIDIGIEAENELPAGVALEIKDKLDELPTLCKFDVVDFKTVSQGFKGVALENIEVIYEQ